MLTPDERARLVRVLNLAWDGKVPYFPRIDGKPYEPNESQESFLASDTWGTGFFGGRGSGKSAAGAQKAIRKVSQGENGIVGNPDFENLKTSTWPELKQWIPWHRVVKHDHRMAAEHWEPRQPFRVHFDNGAWMLVKGMKDPDAARGPNVNWFWYDEPGRDKTGLSFKIAAASVRVGQDPRIWVTGTPAGTKHWLYKFFVLGQIPEEVKRLLTELGYEGELFDYFHGTIHDNIHNLSPFFYATMLGLYEGKFAKQELEGLFLEISEGVVLDNFGSANITNAEPVPGHPIEIAFDDGYIDPRVMLLIQRFPNRILVFDEYYRSRELSQRSVQNVVDRINRWPWKIEDSGLRGFPTRLKNSSGKWLDQESWAKVWPSGAGRPTHAKVRKAMATYLQLSKKGKNDTKGRMAHFPTEFAIGSPEAKEFQQYLRRADFRVRYKGHEIVEGLKKFRRVILDENDQRVLQVNSRCENLIEEITDGYRYPDRTKRRRDNEKPADGDDHGPEALRHWIMVRVR